LLSREYGQYLLVQLLGYMSLPGGFGLESTHCVLCDAKAEVVPSV